MKCMCIWAISNDGLAWVVPLGSEPIYMSTEALWAVSNSTITCMHLHRQLPTQVIYILLWQLPYFFDQTPRRHFFRCKLVFVRLLFESAFISLQTARVRYMCTSDTVTTAGSCQHTRSLPFLLPTVETNRSTQTALVICIRVRVAHSRDNILRVRGLETR